MTRALAWSWLGRVGYRAAWELQESLRARILAGDDRAERLLFLEHDPVVTLGRGASAGSVLASEDELGRRGVELIRTSRGGDATVHGPGQLVIYPVVRLRAGVRAHVEGVGHAIAEELRERGVAAAWRPNPAGVWVDGPTGGKIAACGVHVARGVAIHGFALNVGEELRELFSLIVPCGLSCARVTTMQTEGAAAHLALADLAAALAPRIARALGREVAKACAADASTPR
ncbi:MAG: lipoyl(octanoyl) transferase [Myxococcales bacterium]|nr:lipoyl(octanoyl) transferase [Myxococcales bacterium]